MQRRQIAGRTLVNLNKRVASADAGFCTDGIRNHVVDGMFAATSDEADAARIEDMGLS